MTLKQEPGSAGQAQKADYLRWRVLSVAMFLGLFAVGTAWLTTSSLSSPVTTPSSLAGILLGGVLTFVFSISGLVAIFHALKLTNRQFPLGLPDGSVQALIALILILLFFIMAVFLYLDIAQTSSDRRLLDLTRESFEAIPPEQILFFAERQAIVGTDAAGNVQSESRFDVTLTTPRVTSEVAQEVARQLITTIGTLIVAIASFYFGAKSLGGAKPDETTQTP